MEVQEEMLPFVPIEEMATKKKKGGQLWTTIQKQEKDKKIENRRKKVENTRVRSYETL